MVLVGLKAPYVCKYVGVPKRSRWWESEELGYKHKKCAYTTVTSTLALD